jgi:hypothetical protein
MFVYLGHSWHCVQLHHVRLMPQLLRFVVRVMTQDRMTPLKTPQSFCVPSHAAVTASESNGYCNLNHRGYDGMRYLFIVTGVCNNILLAVRKFDPAM